MTTISSPAAATTLFGNSLPKFSGSASPGEYTAPLGYCSKKEPIILSLRALFMISARFVACSEAVMMGTSSPVRVGHVEGSVSTGDVSHVA